MSEFRLVDPQGWEYDLQSVYSAYIGYFQLHGMPWHDRAWGQFFGTFGQFLSFSWPVITVTDARTGRAHIVTCMASITAFLKMVKSRFGETLPQVDNMLLVKCTEASQRQLWHVSDWPAYEKLHFMLRAVALASLKTRVRAGDPSAIRHLWAARDKSFLALDFECLARNEQSCVEWGYAAIRSSHLVAAGAWPPVPDTNYRKGHYIISEYTDVANKASSPVSWKYAFGASQVITKAKAPRILQSVLSSLVSPDLDTVANDVVLVAHGLQVVMQRLEEMKIKLPDNMLALDIAYLERALFNTGERGQMHDRKTGRVRMPEALLSLSGLLRSLEVNPPCALHNAGNDAFMTLVVFQRMVDPRGGLVVVGATGMENGTGNGVGEREGAAVNGQGQGHVKRVATAAARIFRPQGGAHLGPPVAGANGNGTVSHARHRSVAARGAHEGAAGGADGMGMMNTHMKRASMFSTLRSPPSAPADKQEKGASSGSAGGSGSGFGTWRLSRPLTIVSNQRRHSAVEER